MAACNVIFNLPRSSFLAMASHSLRPSIKTSRVCFTSASKFSKGRNAAEKNRDYSSSSRAYENKDWSTKAKQTLEDDVESGKQRFEEAKGAATEYAQETTKNLKDAAGSIGEKAKEGNSKVAESVESAKKQVKDYADGATEKTKDAAETIAGGTKKETGKVVETLESAKDRAYNAVESGGKTVADKVKEGTSKTEETVK